MTPAYPAQLTFWMLSSSDNKIAVIGLGNTLRRDDGIGILILESLLKRRRKQGADYLNFGIAGIDLLHRIQSYDKVLLIDAINGSISPGELKIFDLSKIRYDFKNAVTSSHEIGLKDLFTLSKKLGIKTKICVAGIQAKDTSYGEGLSEDLKSKEKEITDAIREFIKRDL